MKFLKRFLIFIACLLLFIVCAVPFFIRKLDTQPYQQTAYYHQMMGSLDSVIKNSRLPDTSGILLAGWSKVNITPTYPMPTAGYGKRKGAPYQSVHDSIYARAIFLQQGPVKAAIVSCDLLIIPPELSLLLKKEILSAGISYNQLYIGATHAHNSIGGWGKRFIGELFAGKFDSARVTKLAGQIVTAVKQAASNVQSIRIQSASIALPELVMNRTVGDKGTTDPFLRLLYFLPKNAGSPKALLASFSAHPTTLRDTIMKLSRDYPGTLIDSLEKNDGYDEAVYMAGAVGSMGPAEIGATNWEQLTHMANGLEKGIKENILTQNLAPSLQIISLPLPMREPQWRFAENWCFRHWIWSKLYGDYAMEVKMLRLGNLVMVAMPCDFSGELMKPLTDYAARKGKQLMVTSFNGGYCGYITRDSYYNMPGYETRVMNWFGPGNAAYFSEIIQRLIDIP